MKAKQYILRVSIDTVREGKTGDNLPMSDVVPESRTRLVTVAALQLHPASNEDILEARFLSMAESVIDAVLENPETAPEKPTD